MVGIKTLSNATSSCYITFADIYVASVSNTHCVSAKSHYLAIVSTIVETDNPEAELQPGLKLLGPIKEK